jgi:hypothetical protein
MRIRAVIVATMTNPSTIMTQTGQRDVDEAKQGEDAGVCVVQGRRRMTASWVVVMAFSSQSRAMPSTLDFRRAGQNGVGRRPGCDSPQVRLRATASS